MSPDAAFAQLRQDQTGDLLWQITAWLANQDRTVRIFQIRRGVETGTYCATFEVYRPGKVVRGVAEDVNAEEAIRKALKDIIAQGELMPS